MTWRIVLGATPEAVVYGMLPTARGESPLDPQRRRFSRPEEEEWCRSRRPVATRTRNPEEPGRLADRLVDEPL